MVWSILKSEQRKKKIETEKKQFKDLKVISTPYARPNKLSRDGDFLP